MCWVMCADSCASDIAGKRAPIIGPTDKVISGDIDDQQIEVKRQRDAFGDGAVLRESDTAMPKLITRARRPPTDTRQAVDAFSASSTTSVHRIVLSTLAVKEARQSHQSGIRRQASQPGTLPVRSDRDYLFEN